MKKTSRWGLTKCLAASLIAWQTPMPAAAEKSAAEQEVLLAVSVNHKMLTDSMLILLASDRRIMVPAQLLTAARLRLPGAPAVPAVNRQGQDYYPLDALPGLQGEIESTTQTLNIDAAPAAFVAAIYDGNEDRLSSLPHTRAAAATGAFLNYDLNYARGPAADNLSGLSELGIFNGSGTFTSRFIGLELTGKRSLFRLDSQYARDFPQQQATLVVGDSISGASALSRHVYFGGLQWKTNFSTIPGFQPLPLPTISGTAAAPSTVDIYVNNILRLRQPVETGPFTINNLPVFSGQGNVQMVVHDVLGRQQVTTQSYITSAQLLRQGAQDVSYEIGALRDNFGRQDSRYGQIFSSGTLRYGLSNSATIESHAELMRGRQSAGLGMTLAIDRLGLLSGGLAASHAEHAGDIQQYLQFDRQNSVYALTVRAQTAGARFWQLGLDDSAPAPARLIQAQASVVAGRRATLSLGYVSQVNRRQDDVRAINAGVNFNFRQAGTLSVGLLKALSQERLLSVNAVWVIPLEHQSLLQMTASGQAGNRSLSAGYQQVAPAAGGWGYRARKAMLANGGADIGIDYSGTKGDVMLSANRMNASSNQLLEARGGIALLGGHVRATRWLDQSFAMVEVPPMPAIDIYANNIKVGQTDQYGIGMIPRLVPYEPNQVNLDDSGLPLSMSLDLAQKSVIPGPRSGTFLQFSAQQNKSATLILTDENGVALATGTRVRINGKNEEQEVALRGQVFMPEIEFPATIVVLDASARARCSFRIEAQSKPEPFPKLGPYACRQEIK
ncbi:fimbria/pilus outer membrane usher protein [Paraherbaspirillum soli]|uniref:Fimbria/pilus outer membrane usher protein n=1 Tax=Paraherbaspirillum soli TaxID=631222 RepID=A0ABW0M789_9BURK